MDDKSPHLPLEATNLPLGLAFDGKTLSGTSIFVISNHPIYIYNNETSIVILMNGRKCSNGWSEI